MAIRCIPMPRSPKGFRDTSRRTVELAAKLGVPVVIDFSGCPGDSDNAKYPNWVTCPWPPEYLDLLDWQWEKKVTPYWTEHGKFAKDHGVKIAIEMHPGFVVYSPETMLKLRSIAGDASAATTIRATCSGRVSTRSKPFAFWATAIFHVHAKDTQIYDYNLPKTGVLDTKKYTDERNRGWIFRTCRLWTRLPVVDRVHFHAAHVRLRLRALDRARGFADVARRRIDESVGVPEPDRDPPTCRRLVGVEANFTL